MFRKIKISDSKVLKIKILVSNIRKVNFYSEISNDENSRNIQVKRKVEKEYENLLKTVEVMEIWEIVKNEVSSR